MKNDETSIWIGDLFLTLLDDYYKNNYLNLLKNIVNKKIINEFIVLEWLLYLCPNVKRYIKNAIENDDFFSYSEKDQNMPDFKIGREYYEITSKINIFNDKKRDKEGLAFETRMAKKSWKNSKLKEEKNVLTFRNKDAPIGFDLANLHTIIYSEAFEQILKKIKKQYNIKNKNINIIFWFDRNIENSLFVHDFALKIFIKNNFKSNVEREKYFNKIFKKIKNIYFICENRRTIKKLKGNNPKYSSTCIVFNEEHLKYILKNEFELDYNNKEFHIKIVQKPASKNHYDYLETLNKRSNEKI